MSDFSLITVGASGVLEYLPHVLDVIETMKILFMSCGIAL